MALKAETGVEVLGISLSGVVHVPLDFFTVV